MFWVLFVQYVSGQDNDSRDEGGGGGAEFPLFYGGLIRFGIMVV